MSACTVPRTFAGFRLMRPYTSAGSTMSPVTLGSISPGPLFPSGNDVMAWSGVFLAIDLVNDGVGFLFETVLRIKILLLIAAFIIAHGWCSPLMVMLTLVLLSAYVESEWGFWHRRGRRRHAGIAYLAVDVRSSVWVFAIKGHLSRRRLKAVWRPSRARNNGSGVWYARGLLHRQTCGSGLLLHV